MSAVVSAAHGARLLCLLTYYWLYLSFCSMLLCMLNVCDTQALNAGEQTHTHTVAVMTPISSLRTLRPAVPRDWSMICGTGTCVADAPTARRSRVASRNPTKEHPKIMIEFGSAFERQNAPKSLQKGPPKPLKKHRNYDAVLDRVFDQILYRILLVPIAARPERASE